MGSHRVFACPHREELGPRAGQGAPTAMSGDVGEAWDSDCDLALIPVLFLVPGRQEICESEDQFQMCPLCKKCPYWLLSSICSMFMVRAGAQLGPSHCGARSKEFPTKSFCVLGALGPAPGPSQPGWEHSGRGELRAVSTSLGHWSALPFATRGSFPAQECAPERKPPSPSHSSLPLSCPAPLPVPLALILLCSIASARGPLLC